MLKCFPGLSSAIPMVCGCCGQMQSILLPCGCPPQLPTHFIYFCPFWWQCQLKLCPDGQGQLLPHTRLSLPVPSLLQQHKLLLLRLQQMDPSMNPSTTRKVREDAQPGWSPFTMPEVGRLDSCTSQWFPLGVVRHTEVIVWG